MNSRFNLKPRDYLGEASRKKHLNKQLFTTVAPRYDGITRVLSLNRDRAWKKRLVDALPDYAQPICLDIACGTGDLTRLLACKYPQGQVLGIDLTPAMLELARERVREPQVRFQLADMSSTGIDSDSVDIVTGGYALRNAGDLSGALLETYRVMRPGAHAAFLDFSKPPGRLGQTLTHMLLKCWGGFWGLVLHRNPHVYGYIADSLRSFPDRRELASTLRDTGFRVIYSRLFFFGLIEWITVLKPDDATVNTREAVVP